MESKQQQQNIFCFKLFFAPRIVIVRSFSIKWQIRNRQSQAFISNEGACSLSEMFFKGKPMWSENAKLAWVFFPNQINCLFSQFWTYKTQTRHCIWICACTPSKCYRFDFHFNVELCTVSCTIQFWLDVYLEKALVSEPFKLQIQIRNNEYIICSVIVRERIHSMHVCIYKHTHSQ